MSIHINTPRETIDPAKLADDLGGKWHRSYGVAPCPVCQSDRRKDQNALTINLKEGRLLLHCKKSHCDFKDILTAAGITPGHIEIDRLAMENAERERADQAAKLKARARSLWDYAGSIQGTHGETYLRGRGITCDLQDTLRWTPDIYHGHSGRYCGAMIADVQPTGGIHRTFFTKQGKRLDDNAKMMLGPCSGGAVRLSDAVGPLVVCEGIETGLSLLSGLLEGPNWVWAALSTSGIRGLTLPRTPRSLIIAPDGDEPGREAAASLAQTAAARGWNVSLMVPPDKQDWNDVLIAHGGAK